LAAVRSPRNSAALLKLVLDAGADANAVDNYGRTALMEACETGNREAAHLLLETEGIDLEYRWRGLTAANYAQRRGHMLIAAEVTVQMWLAKRKARKLRDAASTGTDEGSRDEEGRSRLPNVRKFYANLGYEIK
jgi:ankyrin repeat protein